jgi:hypothetical protein
MAGDSFEKLDIGEKLQELAEDALLQVRSFRLTQEQIDDVMDFADEKMRELIHKHQGSLSGEHIQVKLRYLETLDLYGRVLKNLEFIPVDQKREHLRSFLKRIVDLAVAVRRKGIDNIAELADRMENRTERDREQAIRCLEYYVKVIMPTSALSGMMTGVATPKLEALLEDVVNDNGWELGAKIASLFAVLDMDAQNKIELWREFAKNEGRNRYARTLLLSRLGQYYSASPLEKVAREGLENLIGDIMVGRGRPKQLKGRVISELRKRRRIANAGAKAAGGDGR